MKTRAGAPIVKVLGRYSIRAEGRSTQYKQLDRLGPGRRAGISTEKRRHVEKVILTNRFEVLGALTHDACTIDPQLIEFIHITLHVEGFPGEIACCRAKFVSRNVVVGGPPPPTRR